MKSLSTGLVTATLLAGEALADGSHHATLSFEEGVKAIDEVVIPERCQALVLLRTNVLQKIHAEVFASRESYEAWISQYETDIPVELVEVNSHGLHSHPTHLRPSLGYNYLGAFGDMGKSLSSTNDAGFSENKPNPDNLYGQFFYTAPTEEGPLAPESFVAAVTIKVGNIAWTQRCDQYGEHSSLLVADNTSPNSINANIAKNPHEEGLELDLIQLGQLPKILEFLDLTTAHDSNSSHNQ